MQADQQAQFPYLQLFNPDKLKKKFQQKSTVDTSKNHISRTSIKEMNKRKKQFRDSISLLERYEQFRLQILSLAKNFFMPDQYPNNLVNSLLGFRCFTSVRTQSYTLRNSINFLSSLKEDLLIIYQRVKYLSNKNQQQQLDSLINEILFFYYQISLIFSFKEQLKNQNKTQAGFLKFFKKLRFQCVKELQDINILFDSSMIKLKRDLFYLNHCEDEEGEIEPEKTLQKLSEVILNFKNLFDEKGKQPFKKESKLQPKHFHSEMVKVFKSFTDIISKNNAYVYNRHSLQIINCLSSMKYDWYDRNKIDNFTEIQIIIKYCDHLRKIVIDPKKFHTSAQKTYQQILKSISRLFIQEPSHEDSELIQKFKDKIQQKYQYQLFTNFISQSSEPIVQSQSYIRLMLRQVSSFLQIINVHRQMAQLLKKEQNQNLNIFKDKSKLLLNILLYYFQLQRDNQFLQFHAKILLLQVYQLLNIPYKYYIRNTKKGNQYCKVNIQTYVINLREIILNQNPQQQSDFNDMNLLANNTDVDDIQNVQCSYTTSDIMKMKQFCHEILSSKPVQRDDPPPLNLSQNLQNRKLNLNISYVLKQNEKNHEKMAFQGIKKAVKSYQSNIQISKNCIPLLFYKMYMKNITSVNKNSETIIQQFTQFLNDYFQKSQLKDQQKKTLIIILDLLLKAKYEEVLKIFLQKEKQITTQDKLFPILTQTCYICRSINYDLKKVKTEIQKNSLLQEYEKKILIQFLQYCEEYKNQQSKILQQTEFYQTINKFNPVENWDDNHIKRFTRQNKISAMIKMKWLIDRRQELDDFKYNFFEISINLQGLGRQNFLAKFEQLNSLVKSYEKINQKGICRLINLYWKKSQIILTIDVNPITKDDFLNQPSSNFYSQLWFNKSSRNKKDLEALIKNREKLYKDKDRRNLWKLYQFNQYLIRETTKNILFMISNKLSQGQVAPYNFLYKGDNGLCNSISVNPFFSLLQKVFSSSGKENKQIYFQYPFANNMINSQLLNVMMLLNKQEPRNLNDQVYKDRYCKLCSQSFWKQYLCSVRRLIITNHDDFQQIYEKLPLFMAPSSKILFLCYIYQNMKRSWKYKVCNIPPLSRFVQDLKQHYNAFHDQTKAGIINREACLYFNPMDFMKMNWQLNWEFKKQGQKYQFTQRIAQGQCKNNFIDLMKNIRNSFSHINYDKEIPLKMVLISNQQKLRILSSDYPFVSVFLFQRADEMAAFSVKLKRCNKLIQTHKNRNISLLDKAFTNLQYLRRQITIIQQDLEHKKILNTFTNQRVNCTIDNCNALYIRASLLTPIKATIESKGLEIFEFDRQRFQIQYSHLVKKIVGKSTLFQHIIHLLYFIEQYLSAEIQQVFSQQLKLFG